jgi:EpsI family protein
VIQKHRLSMVIAILLFTLGGTYWGLRTARQVVAVPDYLKDLSLPFRDWSVTSETLSPHEYELLVPDAVLLRQYRSLEGTEEASLAVLAGHRKQTVHTPAFCMAGGGWNTVSESEVTLNLSPASVNATRALMECRGQQLLVTYFFSDGTNSTRSLPQFQFGQFFRRLRGTVPQGALVRVMVPIQRDRSSAEQLSDSFIQSVVPDLLTKIRDAQ